MYIKEILSESLTPADQFINKHELAKIPNKEVWYKGKHIGWTTGETENNKAIVNPNIKTMKDYVGIKKSFIKIDLDFVTLK